MTIPELIKDFIDTGKERLKTPISGAFLWSFLIYNWRPIFVLIFSDASIEDKIIVINYEYCSFWAIFLPVVFATMYTLLIPKIMLEIDKDLAPTKDARVTKRYEARKHEIIEKTAVAREEFLLKSEETGNQTVQELNDQIKALQDQNQALQGSIKQIQDSSKANDEGLKSTLNSAQEALKVRDTEILRLQNIINSFRDNPTDFNFPDEDLLKYKRIVSNYTKDDIGLSQLLMEKIIIITDILDLREFRVLDKMERRGNEVNLKTITDYGALASLTEKGVLVHREIGNRLSVIFSEPGQIMFDALLRYKSEQKN